MLSQANVTAQIHPAKPIYIRVGVYSRLSEIYFMAVPTFLFGKANSTSVGTPGGTGEMANSGNTSVRERSFPPKLAKEG